MTKQSESWAIEIFVPKALSQKGGSDSELAWEHLQENRWAERAFLRKMRQDKRLKNYSAARRNRLPAKPNRFCGMKEEQWSEWPIFYEKNRNKRNLFRRGRGDRIWTCGPLVPNQVRYQTAPRPDNFYIITYYVVKVKRFFRFLYYFYIILFWNWAND